MLPNVGLLSTLLSILFIHFVVEGSCRIPVLLVSRLLVRYRRLVKVELGQTLELADLVPRLFIVLIETVPFMLGLFQAKFFPLFIKFLLLRPQLSWLWEILIKLACFDLVAIRMRQCVLVHRRHTRLRLDVFVQIPGQVLIL